MNHLSDNPEVQKIGNLMSQPIKNYILHNYDNRSKEVDFGFNCTYGRESVEGNSKHSWEVSFHDDPISNFFQISHWAKGYGIYGMTQLREIAFRGNVESLEDFNTLERILKIKK